MTSRAVDELLTTFRASLDFDLDDFQVRGCTALAQGRGVLVAAPTGAGKTVVGEFAVHLALSQGRKAFYTTPIKALSNQKYSDLVRRHGADQVGLLTGDTSINPEASVVVMTTEVLRNMLYAGSRTLDSLGFVVMDEVHYLADRFRGPVWEEVILHLPADVQIASLSATVSNAEEFGDWLELVRGDTIVVVSEHRPVPLGQHVLTRDDLHDLYAGHVDPTDPGVDPPINPELLAALRRHEGGRPGGPAGRGRGGPRGQRPSGPPRGGARPVPRFAVVDVLSDAQLLPAIFFIFSRAGCEGALAQCLASGLRLTTKDEALRIRTVVEARCADVPAEDLHVLGYHVWLDGLERGLAAHHAGMLPLFKETVETLFAAGLVKVVFATETLALGINMPARSVVLEKLVKWDGSAHNPLTPGEYTQLTGRAGRRGIDVEGHAVVVAHPGLDPVALAGLASKRLYPLRSAFRPTYNMAVNLVAQVGRTRAREVLETSFAQFQADRGVVGLARQAQQQSEALEGYREAMTCHAGDFSEYARLRDDLGRLERDAQRDASEERRRGLHGSLAALRPGEVVRLVTRRRKDQLAVVIDTTGPARFTSSRPVVLGTDRVVRTLSPDDLDEPPTVVATLRLPKGFSSRNPGARRRLAEQLTEVARAQGAAPVGRAARRARVGRSTEDDAAVASLRRRLREHPCHQCPEREDHARWAERHSRLEREHTSLVRRIEGRTGTIARTFDHTCAVLTELGYLASGAPEDGAPTTVVTAPGEQLRRIYAENDLLVAECLRSGAWDELDAPGLAAVVSSVLYSARRESDAPAHVPGGDDGKIGRALEQTVRVWSRLDDLERAHGLETVQVPDHGLVGPVHAWARGRSLDAVLRGSELAAGDFVRWCKQVIDLLDQLSIAAPTARLRTAAASAVGLLRRGVVAYSSV